MLMHNKHEKIIKSINVFKNHPSNKVTISNGGVPCGEFEIVRSGPKVIFSANGTGKYGMQDMMFAVLNISYNEQTQGLPASLAPSKL